ncbi:MAG: efflux RND transporter periplasmic adaptor subunit, partial [Pseudomonadota bacterium]
MRFGSIALAAAVIAGLSWWFVLRHDDPQSVAQGEVPSNVPTAPLSAADAAAASLLRVAVIESTALPSTEIKRLRGRTEAMRTVEVVAETDGLVVSEPLRAGERVAADQLLCRIDPGSRLAEMREAEAAVAEAAIESEAADQLSERGFTSRTSRIASQAKLQSARAQLDKMKLNLERLDINAPFAGVLESDTAELGARLGVGDVCATVVDLSQLKILGFASERDVDRLTVGQPVSVRLVNGAEREGQIRFVGRRADPATRTYTVEAVIPNPDLALRDGMTAEIEIAIDAGAAHRLPLSVLTLDDEGRLGVRLVEDGVVAFAPVRLLRDDGTSGWLAGLPDQASVIAIGQEYVRAGGRVISVPLDEVNREAEQFTA